MARRTRLSLAALFASAVVWWAPFGFAQDPAKDKDGDLEKFLQNVDEKKSEPPAKKPAGDVSAQDKDLDNFLEKLGEPKDTPAPAEKPGPGDEPAPKPGQPAPDALKGQDKATDEHLEELSGRKHKKKDDGEGHGPLSQLVKEMREVEERLGKPDTGEETRKKQEQIVKQLEQLIQQAQSQGGSGKKKMMLVMRPGQQKGNPEGQQPGTTGGQAPKAKPLTPNNKRSLAGGKDEWGHLPDALRQEMDNVFKEEGLPAKQELIRRYYLSLSKKTVTREGAK